MAHPTTTTAQIVVSAATRFVLENCTLSTIPGAIAKCRVLIRDDRDQKPNFRL